MKEHGTNMELLGEMPVSRALLALGLPTMTGMLVNALYNLADAYFVSGLGTTQMGAVAVAYPLGQVIVGLGLLFGNGAASYLSRLLGYGDLETANKTASTAVYGSVFVGTVVIVCSLLCLEPLLKLLGTPESVMPYALTYTRIYIASSIFNVFNVTMNNIAASEGAAKMTMGVLMTGAVLNVILDPLLIYGFDLGVAGAAIATGLSQMISAVVYLLYIFRKKSMFRFSVRDICLSGKILSEILKIGIPTLVFQLLSSTSISMINDAAADYGDSALAAMGAVTKIMSVGSLVVFGFLKGLQPIAGYSYGAKQYVRLRDTVKTSLIWSTVFCAGFALIVTTCSTAIISWFAKDDPELIRVGTAALRTNGLSFPLFGFYTVYSFLFLAMGKARKGCFLGACRQGICLIPVLMVFPVVWGMRGILWAQPAADVLSAMIAGGMALGLRRELALPNA